MNIRKRVAVLAAVMVTSGLTLASPAGAVGGVVPNYFVRSCYFGCSPFVQSNGAYRSQYPSECITKGWGGTSSYLLPPGRRC